MNESVIIMTDFIPENYKNIQVVEHQQIELGKLYKQSKDSKEPITFVVQTRNYRSFFLKMKRKTKIIKAAGGLVRNGEGGYLFIYRLGKWDLPKGKVDDGEKTKEAAVREVEEECGIKVNYLGPKICSTYHAYILKGELVIKKTRWYEMGVNKVPPLKPQLDEHITRAVWLEKEKFPKVMKNTYRLIEDILDKVQ